MKLGEIKIEALKIMYATYNVDIDIDDLSSPSLDENYSSYLVNMCGAINRCFACIEEKGVLPVKSYTIVHPTKAEFDSLMEESPDAEPEEVFRGLLATKGLTESGSYMSFNLSMIEDYDRIERLVYIKGNAYISDYEYQNEVSEIIIKDFDSSATYKVIYRPRIERVTIDTADTEEIDIPNNIAAHIPYFIKGDLYREDEPDEASEARNWFEAAMDSIQDRQSVKVGRVVDVYSQE